MPPSIKRIQKLGGEVRYDAHKTIIGVDLLECRATDADVKLLTSLTNLRQLALWGAEITNAGVQASGGVRQARRAGAGKHRGHGCRACRSSRSCRN